jgi:hypothetical protein
MNTGAIFFAGLSDEVKEKARSLVANELLAEWENTYQDQGYLVMDRLMEALGKDEDTKIYHVNYQLIKKLEGRK